MEDLSKQPDEPAKITSRIFGIKPEPIEPEPIDPKIGDVVFADEIKPQHNIKLLTSDKYSNGKPMISNAKLQELSDLRKLAKSVAKEEKLAKLEFELGLEPKKSGDLSEFKAAFQAYFVRAKYIKVLDRLFKNALSTNERVSNTAIATIMANTLPPQKAQSEITLSQGLSKEENIALVKDQIMKALGE
jgi:hypothetical protein